MNRRRALLIAFCTLLPACDGSSGANPPDALGDAGDTQDGGPSAGDKAIAAYAGVWSGTTNQGFAASFLVNEEGNVTDVSMLLRVVVDGGGSCTVTFVADQVVPVLGGRAVLKLRPEQGGPVRVPVELSFRSSTLAVGQQAGLSEAFRISCNNTMLDGTAVPEASGDFKRVRGVTMPSATDRRLASGAGSPVPAGFLDSGCSRGPQRHCAFVRYGPLGTTQLWVAPVDEGSAPDSALCAPGNRSNRCQLLSNDLSDPAPGGGGASLNRFQGDTLLFSARGPRVAGVTYFVYYAWRPGWPAARQLLDQLAFCEAEETSDAVVCRTSVTSIPDGPRHADLWAGRLGDGTVPLQKITRLLLSTTADRALGTGATAVYNYGLSPGGQYVLWSARTEDTPGAKETLFALELGAPAASARMLAVDVGRWQLSADAKKIFWLARIDRAGGAAGSLEMADFPVPATPQPLVAEPVTHYYEVNAGAAEPRQLLVLTAGGSLRHLSNVEAALQNHTVIDEEVASIRTWSPDGKMVAYGKTVENSRWGDLFIAPVADPAARCEVDNTTQWLDPVFSSSGRYLVAGHAVFDPAPSSELGLVDSRSCKVRVVGQVPWGWLRLAGDRFAVTSEWLALRRHGIVNLALLDPEAQPSLIPLVDGVSAAFAVHERPEGSASHVDVTYAVNAGWRSDGLYRRTVTVPRR